MAIFKSKNTCIEKKCSISTAGKVGLAVLGVGIVTGTTLVIGIDRIMKKIFVNEDWPDEEWADDDWYGEEIDF